MLKYVNTKDMQLTSDTHAHTDAQTHRHAHPTCTPRHTNTQTHVRTTCRSPHTTLTTHREGAIMEYLKIGYPDKHTPT